MGYKSNDSCLKKAAEDEILFVLRAKDASSPFVVLEWIKINFEDCPKDKLLEAFNCALEMREFPNRRQPD